MTTRASRTYTAAVNAALMKGATMDEIEAETSARKRHAGSVPERNMIKALSMHPWLNDRADWVRLAAALRNM
jgi:hypothetical protein